MKNENQAATGLTVMPHKVGGFVVGQRIEDGYIDATAMCLAAGKLIGHYLENGPTKDFLRELSLTIGIPIVRLVEPRKGRYGGTWIHPRAAVHFGMWLSPEFAVLVSEWVFDWMSGRQPNVPGGNLPYYLRRCVANQKRVPPGHFSMLNEMAQLLVAPLESCGYILPERLWPDISEGKLYSQWLRENGIDTDCMPSYWHHFEDGRAPVQARAYPNELLPSFRKHFETVWLPEHAARYFGERDPEAIPLLIKYLGAKPHVQRIGPRRSLALAIAKQIA